MVSRLCALGQFERYAASLLLKMKRTLSGLTLEQVTLRPDGASHSIYEELWHVVAYQQSVIEPGDPAGDFYPGAAPEHEHQ
jgi:hypothetical protein